MIVKMLEYYLMGKYALVGCSILILYNNIDGISVVTSNFPVTFLTIIYTKDYLE